MAINAEVTKNTNETNLNLIRRFSKRVQGAKILRTARGLRFYDRNSSKLKKKMQALKKITKYKEIVKLKKLGKIK